MTSGEIEFYRGVICVLAAMEPYKQDTIYDYVISTLDAKKLIKVAGRDGSLKWSGLSRYKKRNQLK